MLHRHYLLQLTCRVGGSSCSVGTSLRGLLLLISPEVCEEGTACMNVVATAAIQILPHIYRVKRGKMEHNSRLQFCRRTVSKL